MQDFKCIHFKPGRQIISEYMDSGVGLIISNITEEQDFATSSQLSRLIEPCNPGHIVKRRLHVFSKADIPKITGLI